MNTNKHYYGDSRLNNYCAYCGGPAETEDHVPSRCFLDKPYPQDLPVIPCCHKCNYEFSKDEEFTKTARADSLTNKGLRWFDHIRLRKRQV